MISCTLSLFIRFSLIRFAPNGRRVKVMRYSAGAAISCWSVSLSLTRSRVCVRDRVQHKMKRREKKEWKSTINSCCVSALEIGVHKNRFVSFYFAFSGDFFQPFFPYVPYLSVCVVYTICCVYAYAVLLSFYFSSHHFIIFSLAAVTRVFINLGAYSVCYSFFFRHQKTFTKLLLRFLRISLALFFIHSFTKLVQFCVYTIKSHHKNGINIRFGPCLACFR